MFCAPTIRPLRRSLLLVVSIGLAAIGLVFPTSSRASSGSCTVSSKLVPSCGAWWGVHTHTQSLAALTGLESKVGRRFDVAYYFHTVTSRLPTPDETTAVRQGRILHVVDSPAGRSWRSVAAGSSDASLRAQAAGLKALGVPVFYSFDHEMDSKKAYNVRGSAADYVAAYRHVHDVFAAAGAANVVWVWIVTGYSGNAPKWPGLFPGSRYVDWISADPYAGVNCPTTSSRSAATESFSQSLASFDSWAHGPAAAAAGIGAHMPEILSEYAAAYDAADPSVDARWYAGVPAALKAHPDLRAVQLYDDAGGNCSYTVEDKPPVLAAFTTAGHDSYVNSTH